MIEQLLWLYKSFSSAKIREITIEVGETLIRYLSSRTPSNPRRIGESSSPLAVEFLLSLVSTASSVSSYKLQSLRPSLRSWLDDPKAPPFTPGGECLFGITVLEEVN